MTTLAEAGRRTGRHGRLLRIALALSLTLNVFFVGGLIWVKTFMHPPPPPLERMQRLGDTLSLTADQHRAFEQFVRTIRQHARTAREADLPLLRQIWAEIAKPAPDDDQVAKLGEQVNSNRAAFQREVSVALLSFIKTLTPEQRAQLAQLAGSSRDEPMRRLFQIIAP